MLTDLRNEIGGIFKTQLLLLVIILGANNLRIGLSD